MKTDTLVLALLAAPLLAHGADDYLAIAKLRLRYLEEQVVVAKEKTESPSAWQQCEGTLTGLEEAVAKLPEADRGPFLGKIKAYKPMVVAGAARNRAGNLARRIRDNLDSARADIAAGNAKPANMAEAYFNKLDQYFAEEDLKALPPEELKKLKADYAEIKKRVGS